MRTLKVIKKPAWALITDPITMKENGPPRAKAPHHSSTKRLFVFFEGEALICAPQNIMCLPLEVRLCCVYLEGDVSASKVVSRVKGHTELFTGCGPASKARPSWLPVQRRHWHAVMWLWHAVMWHWHAVMWLWLGQWAWSMLLVLNGPSQLELVKGSSLCQWTCC